MNKLLRTITAVLWSFVGIRDHGESKRDSEDVDLFAVIAVAFFAVVMFIAVLIVLVHHIVS